MAALGVMDTVGQTCRLTTTIYDVVFAPAVNVGYSRCGVIPVPIEPREPGQHLARGCVDGVLLLPYRRGHHVDAALQVGDG